MLLVVDSRTCPDWGIKPAISAYRDHSLTNELPGRGQLAHSPAAVKVAMCLGPFKDPREFRQVFLQERTALLGEKETLAAPAGSL